MTAMKELICLNCKVDFLIETHRKEEVIEFGKWLYEDSNWYIESKKDTFFDDIV